MKKFVNVTFCCFVFFSSGSNLFAAMTPQQFKDRLKGPICSVPTPFNSDYSIDYPGVESIIKRALDFQCQVVAMTAGNGAYDRITFEEVKKLTWVNVHAAHPRAVCLAASGSWPIEQVLEYARYAEEIGADALQIMRPAEITEADDIVDFFKRVDQETGLGIVIHGGPKFTTDLLKKLLEIDSVIAMKEDADLHAYINRQSQFGDRIAIFGGGNEARYLHGQPYGSPAYYSTLYTYAPQIGLEFWQAIQADDHKKAVLIVEQYDLPFIKQFSRPLWLSFIRYSGGGNNHYYRPQHEATEETYMKMSGLFESMELTHTKPNFWVTDQGPTLPSPRGGHAAGFVQKNLVITGGCNWTNDKSQKIWLNETLIFKDEKWTPGPTLPERLSYSAYACDDSALYLLGGKNAQGLSASVYGLDDTKGYWKTLPDLPRPVSGSAAVILNSKLYVATGETGDGNSKAMHVLDLKKRDAWKKCTEVPGSPRCFPALTALNDKLYLLGGLSNPFVPLKDAIEYDPATDQWTQLDDLPIKGYCWNASPVNDKQLLLTGRADDSETGIHRGVWLADLTDMSCRRVAETLVPAATGTLVSMAPGEWWMIGGEPDSNQNRTSVVTVIRQK